MTFYVDAGGSDLNTGAITNPWVSLSHACSQVLNFGDIIHVNAGTYTDNTQCVLATGVKIQGASSATVTINSTANPYISAVSAVPTVDGSNEISGITFTGSGSNGAITSTGRSNQLIHDNVFHNFPIQNGVLVQGKAPTYTNVDTTLVCSIHSSSTIATPNQLCTVQPLITDWATGVQIYNNTATNTSFIAHTLKGAKIHDNTIDNSANPGVSAFGHTAFFWNGVDFFNNTLHINSNTQTTINLEVWEIQNNTKFHDNVFDGWISLIQNTSDINLPYSFSVINNDFSSNVTYNNIGQALEIGYSCSGVLIKGNYFTNTGSNATYTNAISVWGSGNMSGIYIEGNVLYNLSGPGIIVDSTFVTPGAVLHPANINGVYIYNNVFDNVNNGSGGVRVTNNGTSGTLSEVVMRNNLFLAVTYGLTFSPIPANSGGNIYDHNWIDSYSSGQVNPNGISTVNVGINFSGIPNILGSGNRSTDYYAPSNPSSNLVGQGLDVGISFFGSAPNIGAFDIPFKGQSSALSLAQIKVLRAQKRSQE